MLCSRAVKVPLLAPARGSTNGSREADAKRAGSRRAAGGELLPIGERILIGTPIAYVPRVQINLYSSTQNATMK